MTNSCFTHKIARRSKLAWSEMVIFRLRIFALQLELCSGLWTFATYKHLAEWRLKHTWVDELNSDEAFVSKYAVSLIWRRPKCLIRNICVTVRVSLEVAPSSSSSHLLWYSADGSKDINFKVEKFSFGSLKLALKWWFIWYLARRYTLLSKEAKTSSTQI